MKLFKKKNKDKIQIPKPVPPELLGFDKFIISISVFLFIVGLFAGGVQLMTGLIVGLGFVIGIMIVMMKFKWIREIIFRRSRYIDAGALFIGLLLSTTQFAMLVATFGGVFLSAFLSLYGFKIRKEEYNEKFEQYKMFHVV